ncbi:hypothetical protein HYW11_00790 [Candidatus Peregrinibacteria bacterium]|nr:hypothetical protein [Candidatus Peregrinibacteria bacterium]
MEIPMTNSTAELLDGLDLRKFSQKVDAALVPYGFKVIGTRTFIPRRFQRKRRGICIGFDVATQNPFALGMPYDNARRIVLLNMLYETLGAEVYDHFSDHQICLDAYPHLREPFIDTPYAPPVHTERSLDVTKDNTVVFVPVQSLLENGEVERGSDFDVYCRKYDLTDVLRHGPHYISPDILSVEALEAVHAEYPLRSVLEIGGGVGTCGVAAERFGIEDYTFVELNPTVCDYLKKRFPHSTVINQSGLDVSFDQHFDLVLMGMPYELNAPFLEQRGQELAAHSSLVVFQSGTPTFFEFEHDWILGRKGFEQWPWWKETQTLLQYFPHVRETRFDWQLGIVAGNQELDPLLEGMRAQGFSD